ncbi:Polyketide cyclase / dehydrase and lipid transport [Lutibacter agarilyticus]|uniref:Polyketide cyclase / dehydrase and lipid transport n=1 Tax=Lutibacter agarilyticus TaxID=1109740 RepID=A0A238X0T7_9FLAO|nr:SRPBCC family protein [Lutibacter agarilyticus]SNR52486.1 Polyketide cyclase / dehydrase and lipid transport [Lutibacter agarilyticus]
MTIFFYVILILILLVIILANIAPKNYDVSRSVIIKKPLPEVFTFLKLLKNQDEWSPWAEKDPAMRKTFTGTDGEVGFVSAWVGNKEVGEGEQELTGIIENEVVKSQLRFLKPFKSTSDAYLKVFEDENGTKVVWGFSGKNKFPLSIMMLFMNMDKSVGKDFEYGLKKLKEILEA